MYSVDGVECVQLRGDDSQCYTVLPRLTPVPVRRQKQLTLTSTDTSALVVILQRLPASSELLSLAQVSSFFSSFSFPVFQEFILNIT